MLSRRATFAVALGASVCVHAALWWGLPRYPGRRVVRRPQSRPAELAILAPAPRPKPPEPVFGETTGGGHANDSSPGDVPQSSPKPLTDQAALTRDPTGDGPLAAAAPRPQPMAQPVTAPPPAPLPTPPPSPMPAFHKPTPPQPPAPPTDKPKGPRTPDQPPTPPAPPTPTSAGGTPRPHSDTDSDPFASQWSVEFKQGQVLARRGRAHKIARPKVNMAAWIDTAEIALPATVQFHVTIDAAGRPRKVTVSKSSGSDSFDRAFLLALYDSWFEPAKDGEGKPIGDQFTFEWMIVE